MTVKLLVHSLLVWQHLRFLEGISGTGKTSLPYAMGKFFQFDASIIRFNHHGVTVQMIGYLNEFTKFNETDFLKDLYERTYREDVTFMVLDEMNLARIGITLQFLSIMEMQTLMTGRLHVPDTLSDQSIF